MLAHVALSVVHTSGHAQCMMAVALQQNKHNLETDVYPFDRHNSIIVVLVIENVLVFGGQSI